MRNVTLPKQHATTHHITLPSLCIASLHQCVTMLYCAVTLHRHTIPLQNSASLRFTNTIHYGTEPNHYITMRYDTELYRYSTLLCVTSPRLGITLRYHYLTIQHKTFAKRYLASRYFTETGQHNAIPQLY
jgi:hypothetical protein